MARHLNQRTTRLLAKFDQVVLATCGPAGPQACIVECQWWREQLHLMVQRSSDHIYNLDARSELVLVSPEWVLHGSGTALEDHAVVTAQPWQAVVRVQPFRLHVLDRDSSQYKESIDL